MTRLLAGLASGGGQGGEQGTADAEADQLPGNIEAVGQRLQTQRDRATLVRRWYLPTANGTARP